MALSPLHPKGESGENIEVKKPEENEPVENTPVLKQIACTHNSITLSWNQIENCRTYIIEEKDTYGIGRVFAGHANQCSLRGLEPLCSHEYRLKYEINGHTKASSWVTLFTGKEPVNTEHLIRACRSNGKLKKNDYF